MPSYIPDYFSFQSLSELKQMRKSILAIPVYHMDSASLAFAEDIQMAIASKVLNS